jgi:beta-lactamase regulating signal transducer with metallopeptidase domain
METVFLHLLNNGINAGWLVLAVLLLRFFLKKAPKWINVALWGLVALRLVLPFSIESVFSLIPSAQTIPPTIIYDKAPEIESGIPAVNEVLNPIITETFAPDPTTSANPLQIWGFVASAIWLVGLILMVGYMLFGYFRLRLRLRTATKYRENVYESEQVSSPFILGIFRPRIFLPYNLDEQTRAHVLAHEQTHLKRRDHLLKPLAFLLLAVYWFQPLLWLAYIILCRDIEYACDEKVIKNESEETRRAYSMALLSCSVHRRALTACPLAFGEVGVKQRIKNVMNYKKPAFWFIILAVVALIVIAVCFLTDPVSNEPFSIEDLPRHFPEYYSLDTSKGIEVYLWQSDNGEYRCGAMSGTNRNKTYEDISILEKNGVTIEQMKTILASYDIDKEKIIIIPITINSTNYEIETETFSNISKLFWDN